MDGPLTDEQLAKLTDEQALERGKRAMARFAIEHEKELADSFDEEYEGESSALTFDYECQGPTVCKHVFKFDPQRLIGIIQKVVEQDEEFRNTMRKVGILSAFGGNITASTLATAFAHGAHPQGITCPKCGWVNSWNDIAVAFKREWIDPFIEEKERRKRVQKAEQQKQEKLRREEQQRARDQQRNVRITEQKSIDMQRADDKLLNGLLFGHKVWLVSPEGTKIGMYDNEGKIIRVWERKADGWHFTDRSGYNKASSARPLPNDFSW